MLSHRISFTKAIATRFPGMVSYQDVKGKLRFDDYSSLICQVDSLSRLDDQVDIDLLIIDELESILSQLNTRKNQDRDIYKVIYHLLRTAKKIVCMDGFLTQKSVDLIKLISKKEDVKVIVNTY